MPYYIASVLKTRIPGSQDFQGYIEKIIFNGPYNTVEQLLNARRSIPFDATRCAFQVNPDLSITKVDF